MIIPIRKHFIISCLTCMAPGLLYFNGHSQCILPADSQYTVVVAGKQYAISDRQQIRWGKHYRKEWNTPVKVSMLDTLARGLTPYQPGGDPQSKPLREKITLWI